MKIPNNNLSFVADNKITDYLLSDIHEIGKHKADFFKRFGFDISDVDTFKGSLIQHSIDRDIEKTKEKLKSLGLGITMLTSGASLAVYSEKEKAVAEAKDAIVTLQRFILGHHLPEDQRGYGWEKRISE